MDLRQMRYFTALFEERNITRAARRVNVVPAAVSQHIRRVELQYGVELFERTATGVVPNAIAKRLYAMCADTIAAADEVAHVLQAASGAVSGRVTFGVLPSLKHAAIAEAMLNLRDERSEIELVMRDGYSHQLLDDLATGELDFAILARSERHPVIDQMPFAEEVLGVAVSARTFDGASITGAEFARLRIVLPSSGNFQRERMLGELAAAGLDIVPELEIDSLSTVLEVCAAAGWASIISPSVFPESGRHPDLRCVPLVEPSLSRTLVVAYAPQARPSPAAECVVEYLFAALRRSSGLRFIP